MYKLLTLPSTYRQRISASVYNAPMREHTLQHQLVSQWSPLFFYEAALLALLLPAFKKSRLSTLVSHDPLNIRQKKKKKIAYRILQATGM